MENLRRVAHPLSLLIALSGLGASAEGLEIIELVGPGTCTTGFEGRYLLDCALPKVDKATENAVLSLKSVPLRTELHFSKEGNCQTAHPLNIAVFLNDADEPTVGSLFARNFLKVRAPERKAAERIRFEDATPASTKRSYFHPSCRVRVEIRYNRIDCDSAEQARKILAAIERESTEAKGRAELLKDWLELEAGFDLAQFLVSQYELSLTEASLQTFRELRAKLDAAAFAKLLAAPSVAADRPLSDSLLKLQEALAILDAEGVGQERSIADTLGTENAGLLERLKALSAKRAARDAELGAELQRIEELKIRHEQASVLLADFLKLEASDVRP